VNRAPGFVSLFADFADFRLNLGDDKDTFAAAGGGLLLPVERDFQI
jgi:hypothetical protein